MPHPSVQDIVKLIKAGATIEAQEKVMELRQALMDAQDEALQLRVEIQKLRDDNQRLETRVRELQAPSLPRCPRCGKPAFALKRSQPDNVMGAVGMFRRLYECGECGFSEDRLEEGTQARFA